MGLTDLEPDRVPMRELDSVMHLEEPRAGSSLLQDLP